MKKLKYTALIIMFALAGYGTKQLHQNVDVIYKEGGTDGLEALPSTAEVESGVAPDIQAAIDAKEAAYVKFAGGR